MKDLLKYYVSSLSHATLTLKKKSILIEKPWALVDNDGAIQKLIFRRDKRLVLSKNGVVTEGSWDYYSEARSLFIDRGADKLLLNEQYIDENALILKKDGTDNDFFALANENTIPNYDVLGYLESLKCSVNLTKKYDLLNGEILLIDNIGDGASRKLQTGFYRQNSIPENVPDGTYLTKNKNLAIQVKNGKVKENYPSLLIDLIDGNTLQTYGFQDEYESYVDFITGKRANLFNSDNTISKAPDGDYMTKDRNVTINVKSGFISHVKKNALFSSYEGPSYEIENNKGFFYPENYLDHKISINGKPVNKEYFQADKDIIFKLNNSVITQLIYIRDYRLNLDFNIKVKHKDSPKFKIGDKIVHSEPIHPIPDGKYKIKGKLKWIRVQDGIIV